MKKLKQKDIDTEYSRIVDTIDGDDIIKGIKERDWDIINQIFEAGINFAYEQNKKVEKIYKSFNELGRRWS